jgi:Lrp/AsnC family leucine-responsive transcriptional regulator
MTNGFDEIDLRILDLLQENARIKRNEIAEKIGLSIPSVTDRLNKLEDNEVIEKYLTKLNHKALGKDITAFIFISSESSSHYGDFVNHVMHAPEILECHSVTGDGSHVLKIRTANTTSLEKLLAKIQSWKGVRSTRTSIALTTHKESFALDIKTVKK